MAEQLKILFLPHPLKSSLFKPWGEDVLAAMDNRHTGLVGNPETAAAFEGLQAETNALPGG